MNGHDSNCINHLDFIKVSDDQKEIIAQHNTVVKKEVKPKKSPQRILQDLQNSYSDKKSYSSDKKKRKLINFMLILTAKTYYSPVKNRMQIEKQLS